MKKLMVIVALGSASLFGARLDNSQNMPVEGGDTITIQNKTENVLLVSAFIDDKNKSELQRVGFVYSIQPGYDAKIERPGKAKNIKDRYVFYLPIPEKYEIVSDSDLLDLWNKNFGDSTRLGNDLSKNRISITSGFGGKKTVFSIDKVKYEKINE